MEQTQTKNVSNESEPAEKVSKMDPRAQAVYDEILSQHPTENDCARELMKHANITCDHCGYANLQIGDERKIRCPRCQKFVWFTANSYFKYVKKPRLYLVTMTLLARGIVINATKLAQLTKVKPNTATNVLKKFGVVISRHMKNGPHKLVNAAVFARTLYKRSRLSIAAEHPRFEFYKRALVYNLAMAKRTRDLKKLDECEQKLYRLVGRKSVNIDLLIKNSGYGVGDALAGLTSLQRFKRIIKILHFKDVVREHPVTTWFAKMKIRKSEVKPVAQNLRVLQKTFRGVGRKYIQPYLALLWCWSDRATWTEEFLHKAVCKHPSIRSNDLLAYDSPDRVLASFWS